MCLGRAWKFVAVVRETRQAVLLFFCTVAVRPTKCEKFQDKEMSTSEFELNARPKKELG